ncbi:MAG: ribose-phosphate pyrophosphokinase [Gammaproteobacteria bacterium]|nr:ribose-phosphate pyrophosphokinase [Gammaproteobacteria bacterium]
MVGNVLSDNIVIFSGKANPAIARQITQYLDIPLGNATVTEFSDGEIAVEINENVRGKDVFIIQPTSKPSNDHLMQLLVMVDAVKRASADRVTAVIPYFGYARQDRRVRSQRVPITAKVIANMLTSVGVNRVLTIDLHAEQIQGFFDIPVDNVYASPILMGDIWRQEYPDMIVVSPDVGGVVRARAVAKQLGDAELAIIDKRRPKANKAEVMHIIGDVEGKTCIIVDDMVDTAGTLCAAAIALKEHGASGVFAYCTHAVLSGNAIQNLNNSVINKLIVTDTVPLSDEAMACERVRQVTISKLLAETIRRIHLEESVSSLYMD